MSASQAEATVAPAPMPSGAQDSADGEAAVSPKPSKDLGPLRMVWRAAVAYPGRLAMAAPRRTILR